MGENRIKRTGGRNTSACLLWIVSALWLGLCLYLSWQTGEETTGLSEEITQGVKKVAHLFGYEVELSVLHAFLRKSAHGAVFFIAGVLCYAAFKRSLPKIPRLNGISAAMSIVLCSLTAVAAETGKVWIPGRHLQWDETLLGVLGAICGAGIGWAVGVLRGWKRK